MSNFTDTLRPDEWQILSGFGLKVCGKNRSDAHDTLLLLDDEICLATLHEIMPKLGAPNLKVTASLVIKRIAFLVLAPTLYAMSCYNKGLDVAIKNCVFEYQLNHRMWCSGMPLRNIQVSRPVSVQDRDAWRHALLRQAFDGHLALLVAQFHTLTKVPTPILWENIAVRIFSIYEKRILPSVSGAMAMLARNDLAFLVDPETRWIFGVNENPITRFYRQTDLFGHRTEPIRMRRTCCYYYQATKPAIYCKNCPLLLKKALKTKY